jgi:hypothetical protein
MSILIAILQSKSNTHHKRFPLYSPVFATMAADKLASLSADELQALLEDRDSSNTKNGRKRPFWFWMESILLNHIYHMINTDSITDHTIKNYHRQRDQKSQ